MIRFASGVVSDDANNPPPKYRKQKTKTGARAFVELGGQRHYLGSWGSPESKERYLRLLAERGASGEQSVVLRDELTVAELVAHFWRYAETYYRHPDGSPTSEINNLKYAVRPLVALYGTAKVSEVGPRALRTVRRKMIALNWSRNHINKSVARIKTIFRWGTEHELVIPTTYQALAAVRGLAKGRSEAREADPVKPVPEHAIEAVRSHLPRQVWALIQLQLNTGARPGELLGLRAVDIDTAGRAWSYRPVNHKCAHHGHDRVIFFGPKSQQVLAPFMADRPLDSPLFSPREAETVRHARAETHRRPDQRPNPKKTIREVGGTYTIDSYRRAIQRACKAAGVAQWSPHRLRHSAATNLRAEFGIDVAQTVLGHRLGSAITELYAEPNVAKAIDAICLAG